MQNSVYIEVFRSPILAALYWQLAIARHSSSGHQPNFAASQKEWNYRTFAEGATYIRQGGLTLGIGPRSSFSFHFITLFVFFWFGAAELAIFVSFWVHVSYRIVS